MATLMECLSTCHSCFFPTTKTLCQATGCPAMEKTGLPIPLCQYPKGGYVAQLYQLDTRASLFGS